MDFKDLENALKQVELKKHAADAATAALEFANKEYIEAKGSVQKFHDEYLKTVQGLVSNGGKTISH